MKPVASGRKRPPARQYTDDGDGGPPQPPARKMPPSKSASAGRLTRPDLEEKGLAPGGSSTSVAMMAAAQGGSSHHRRPKQTESSFAKELPTKTAKTAAPQAVARGSAAAGRPKEDYDYYNEDDKHLKMKKKMAFGGEKDSVSLGYFGSEEEKMEEHSEMMVAPGAVNVPGVASGQFQSPGSVMTSRTPHSLPGDSGGENLVHAFLVDDDERLDEPQQQYQQQSADLPLRVDAKAVEYKPWYKRPPVILALVLLCAGILGVVLGVTLTRDSGGGNDVETMFPTSSPAPTALTDITIVVQLDEQPAETGWSLVCDDEEVQDVPQGSYAFLPIGILIPSYRIEITAPVMVGSLCVYTITDAGGDGLIGGFFEVYYGDDIGDSDSRLERGVPLSSSQSVQFTVAPPPTRAPTPVAPTVPTSAPTPDTNVTCTVCPDGSAVPNADLLLTDLGKTCGELDEAASNVLANSTACPELQTTATECGCPNFCDTVCPDGSLIDPSMEDTLVTVENGRPLSCGDLQDNVMMQDTSVDKCNRASFFGEEFCGCPGEGTFCRICEPGGPSRIPGNLTREIIPGVACEDISGIAYTLLRDDPRFSTICPACLSIGEYCDCPEVENPRTFCRLCGDRLLPEPDRIVFSPLLNITTTCFHVEFHSNLGISPDGTTTVISDCSVVQEQNAAECCT